jgi:Protein of unknown function (DUF3224)
MARANAPFKIEGWDEQQYAELGGGGKLTRANVEQAFSGDIEGAGSVQWLMRYRPDQTAEFVGLLRIVGRLGDREGSFVLLQTAGTFDGNEAKGELAVVASSVTGELDGLRGTGHFSAPREGEPSLTLDYDFE